MNQLDLFETLAGIIKPVTDCNNFYNTIGLTKEQLTQQRVKTGTQNHKILEWFREHPGREFTPSQVWRWMDLPNVPLTSIRRAITDLTFMGYLERTETMRDGLYGKPEGCWRVKK